MALVSARLAQKDYTGALKAIDALEKKLPAGAIPDFLRGRVALARDDRAGASRAFEAALAKDGQYFPAAAALSSLDLAAGRRDQARQRFEALLKANPKSHLAHLALADLTERAGGTAADVRRHLNDAIQAAPTEAGPRLQLVNHLLRAGDAKAALSAAQDAATAMPDAIDVQDALGRAQIAAGDGQQAVQTFRKVATAQPQNAQLQVRLAEAQFALKDKDGARASLKRALEVDPKLFAAQRALATIAMSEQKPDEALAIARGVQKASPQDAAGFALEGEIQSVRKDWPAAATALRAALALRATPELAIALHAALLNGGQRADADRWSADWQKGHPKDVAFRYHLGDVALTRADWAAAEAHYRAVLEWQPQNALAMNNVAWLLVRQGKPGATPLAERATQLMPDRPVLLDTLATALAADKQFPRAIEVQKQAVQRSPQEPGLRLNLARIYLSSGDKAQARTELQALAALGATFKGQAEVSELLKAVQ
jgi:putative PEP-CTERM system TPR-repeat lipoprotein